MTNHGDVATGFTEYAEAELCRTLDILPTSAVLYVDGTLTYVNQSAADILESDPQALVGRKLADFVHPMDQARSASRLKHLEKMQVANTPTRMRLISALGNDRNMLVSSRKVRLDSGIATLICGMDATPHAQAEAALRESEQNFRRLFESMTDVYYRTDARGVVQMVGPGVRRVLGYEPHEIVGHTAEAYYPNPSDRDALKKAIMENGEVTDFYGQMVRRDGKIIDISISSHILHDEDGNYAGVEGIYRDVTERMMLERELRRHATTDALTGIANRRAFFEQAEQVMKGCKRYQETVAVLMLDLDHFKSINDHHGHSTGDDVLVRFAQTVTLELRETDIFGRLGGEEFCIVLRHATPQIARHVCSRILEQVRTLSFKDEKGGNFSVTVSIGLALSGAPDEDLDGLISRADKALYKAKHSQRDCMVYAE